MDIYRPLPDSVCITKLLPLSAPSNRQNPSIHLFSPAYTTRGHFILVPGLKRNNL